MRGRADVDRQTVRPAEAPGRQLARCRRRLVAGASAVGVATVRAAVRALGPVANPTTTAKRPRVSPWPGNASTSRPVAPGWTVRGHLERSRPAPPRAAAPALPVASPPAQVPDLPPPTPAEGVSPPAPLAPRCSCPQRQRYSARRCPRPSPPCPRQWASPRLPRSRFPPASSRSAWAGAGAPRSSGGRGERRRSPPSRLVVPGADGTRAPPPAGRATESVSAPTLPVPRPSPHAASATLVPALLPPASASSAASAARS